MPETGPIQIAHFGTPFAATATRHSRSVRRQRFHGIYKNAPCVTASSIYRAAFVMRRVESSSKPPSPADWRPVVVRRSARLITVIGVPATAIIVFSPSPFSLFDRLSVAAITVVTALIALLARDPRRGQVLAAVLVGSLVALCMELAMRMGMVPGLAFVLGGTLVLVAIFFGPRAVWWVLVTTSGAMVALGAANQAGWLHPTDPAQAFDWSKMSVWVRVAAGYVGVMSVTASAVATVIAHLEESLRDRDRLLVAEREAIFENERLLTAEKHARERLSRLQQVTASLSRASTPDEVIDAVCRITCEGMEGFSAVVWMRGDDGALRIAGSWGSTTEYLDHFRVVPPDADLPVQHVARSGQPMWIETEEDSLAASSDAHARALAAGRLKSYCIFALAVNGVVRGVLGFSQPIGHRFDDDEKGYYTALSLHCAYALERATLHEAAREAAARAEAANRIKDEFLSTVSHELRTPLNAITGWVHMLRSGSVPAERREHALQVIDRNAGAQAKLIADLLDVSRISAGHLRLNIAPVDLPLIVQMAIDSVKPAAEAKGIRIAAILEADQPVLGDVGRLQQVVWNLLTNGVKFSARGGVLEVALRHEAPNVVVTVRDHGEGIHPAFLPFLFEPFRQADAGFKRLHGGLGLGLTITRKLVELHGGTIQAHSDGAGKGATFVVRVPAASKRTASQPDAAEVVRAPDLLAGRALRGLQVLLVEDEPDTRELLLALFDACGANARGASSAADALAQFNRGRPDVIVSDVGLRGEDGLTLVRTLRSLPGGDVPAVALTAFARAADRDVALAAGFDAHVAKPIEPERFLKVVTGLLKDRRARQALQA
jgi:signal transduction histidine kinase/ActR/RegA family two-component response regulator